MKNPVRASLVSLIIAAGLQPMLPSPLSAQTEHSFQQITPAAGSSLQVETGPAETVEVILPGGGSVIVAPGGAVSVQVAADGCPTVQIDQGLVRVAGDPACPSTMILTPEAQLELEGGAAMVEVTNGATRTHMLFGASLNVVADGVAREIYRPGFEVTVGAGGAPSQPRRMTESEVLADLVRLSVGLSEGTLPRLLSEGGGGSPSGSVAEEEEETTADAGDAGAALPPVERPQARPNTGGSGPGPITPPGGSLGSGGLAPTLGPRQTVAVSERPTTKVDTNTTVIRQQFDNAFLPGAPFPDGFLDEARVYVGPTTNRLFPTSGVTLTISEPADLGAIVTSGTNGETGEPEIGTVVYYYATSSAGLASSLYTRSGTDSDTGLVRFRQLPTGVFRDLPSFRPGAYGDLASTTFTLERYEGQPSTLPEGISLGTGVIAAGLNFGTNFPRASLTVSPDPDGTGVTLALDPSTLARRDNFMFLDMQTYLSVDSNNPSCSTACFDAALSQVANAFQGTVVAESSNAALIATAAENRRYIFATGGLDEVIGNRTPGHRVDEFSLSAGMEGPIRDGLSGLPEGMHTGDGSRAFLRAETWTGLASREQGFALSTSQLAQSPFYVVNPKDLPVITRVGEDGASPVLLFADAAVANGPDGQQVSTISAAIGEVEFRFGREYRGGSSVLGNTEMVDALLNLHVVGSSQGLTTRGATSSSVLITSNFESTAAGGGNPNIDTDSNGVSDPGRLGFFVLENAGRSFDDAATTGTDPDPTGEAYWSTLPGGTERAFGGRTQDYAALRLGVATGSELVSDRPNSRTNPTGSLGYGAAILESGGDAGGVTLSYLGGSQASVNLRFTRFNDDLNTFSVRLGDLALGGRDGQSAYVDDKTYGARSSGDGSDVALIAGDMVVDAFGQELVDATSGYDHVKWGFFFGDTSTAGSDGGRTHAHLGSYAAGTPLTASQAAEVTGQADVENAVVTYNGHLVGNVSEGANVRTATGTYQDTFDFGSRRGEVAVEFDGRDFGTATSRANRNLRGYNAQISSGGIRGELNGHFIAPIETRRSIGGSMVRAPAGVVGAFSLSDGAAGDYRAVGTFAGE